MKDLTGIGVFTETESLYCSECGLTNLPLGGLKKLGFLVCSGNRLTELDTSGNPELYGLICTDNVIESLDVSANPLVKLMCENNRLTQIDVRGKELYFLYCSGNLLTSVDMTGQPFDVDFACEGNVLAVNAENGIFDLTRLPGFDPSRASGWTGGTVKDGILAVPESGNVTYTYDCGEGYSAVFTLAVTVTEPSASIPGDANGDGTVDMLDALRILQFLNSMELPIRTENADADHNGSIDFRDAMLILQYVCGWDTVLQ